MPEERGRLGRRAEPLDRATSGVGLAETVRDTFTHRFAEMFLYLAQRPPNGARRAAQLQQQLVEEPLDRLGAAHAGLVSTAPTAPAKRCHSRRSPAAAVLPAGVTR